jgi:hypothetical protein
MEVYINIFSYVANAQETLFNKVYLWSILALSSHTLIIQTSPNFQCPYNETTIHQNTWVTSFYNRRSNRMSLHVYGSFNLLMNFSLNVDTVTYIIYSTHGDFKYKLNLLKDHYIEHNTIEFLHIQTTIHITWLSHLTKFTLFYLICPSLSNICCCRSQSPLLL